MKLAHRIAYYLGGFSIGIVILLFFLGGKRASCDYGPNARTLKNIRLKERFYSENALSTLRRNGLDSTAIESILNDGDVLFSESNTDLQTCKQYVIEGTVTAKVITIMVENCEERATILKASVEAKN
ncbi:DUF4258 domain-containing protein [Altibacter lentus]|uniref:DUF4258 domain-containing protein n=1 Tax=Altibacter lentus TaxID=1223410 RepID=UPI0005535FD1|nr:DUF4258 domain-containing protein [Altibacter lentus]